LTQERPSFAAGETVELCHDTHERLPPSTTVQLAKALEPYRLFFLEDSLPPEQGEHFRIMRQHSTVPIAMGELFVNVNEYLPLIKDRLIDFIRVHMSDIGGLTPMIKLAALCEFFGVRVALHGPGDCSPVGMMANLAIDLSSTSFGIQEFAKGTFNHEDYTDNPHNANDKVFPGLEKCRLHDSMFWPNDLPGLGIDVDEVEAAKHPWPTDKARNTPFLRCHCILKMIIFTKTGSGQT
jgi:mannonate dehydratase